MRRWGSRQGAPRRGLEFVLEDREKRGSPERSPHSDAVRAEEGSDRSGIRWSMVVARVLERDRASTMTSWWCRLDWRGGRSGSLPATSLPQLDRAPAGSPGGRQLTLRTEEEVAGATQWLDGEALRRRPSDGDTGVEEQRGVALPGRADPDRGVGPVLDHGRAVGSRTHGG
jgi:hypothetical protein